MARFSFRINLRGRALRRGCASAGAVRRSLRDDPPHGFEAAPHMIEYVRPQHSFGRIVREEFDLLGEFAGQRRARLRGKEGAITQSDGFGHRSAIPDGRQPAAGS